MNTRIHCKDPFFICSPTFSCLNEIQISHGDGGNMHEVGVLVSLGSHLDISGVCPTAPMGPYPLEEVLLVKKCLLK